MNESRNVKIKKAHIIDGLFLKVEFKEDLPGHSKNDTKITSTVPIHDDLRNAFIKFNNHLAILCDQEKAPKPGQLAQLVVIGYFVGGFTISGNEENEGIVIDGSREGKYGTIELSTPCTKYAGSKYPFATEMAEDIQAALYEVEEYLFNGKRAPEQQLELGLGGDDGTEVKKAKKSSKKDEAGKQPGSDEATLAGAADAINQ